MRLSSESKLFIAILLGTVAIITGAVFFMSQPEKTLSKSDLLPIDTYTKGNKNASSYLVEFSDFQCPACGTFKPLVDQVTDKYKDKLLFGYRHFPLYNSHPFAEKAALAAEAAGRQGKFWEMYEYLFESQEKFSDEVIMAGATVLKLDKEKFDKDINDPKLKDKINRDVAAGNSLGVNATPTFFLNGKKLNISSFDDLENSVKAEINK